MTVPVTKTVGVGHSRRYCNTGYDQSQGRRPSTLKCIGSISKGDIEPNHPSEINPNSDSRSRSDGRSHSLTPNPKPNPKPYPKPNPKPNLNPKPNPNHITVTTPEQINDLRSDVGLCP